MKCNVRLVSELLALPVGRSTTILYACVYIYLGWDLSRFQHLYRKILFLHCSLLENAPNYLSSWVHYSKEIRYMDEFLLCLDQFFELGPTVFCRLHSTIWDNLWLRGANQRYCFTRLLLRQYYAETPGLHTINIYWKKDPQWLITKCF